MHGRCLQCVLEMSAVCTEDDDVFYCIMRSYTEGRLDRYRVDIPRELSEIRTQPWLSEGSLTCDLYHHRGPIF